MKNSRPVLFNPIAIEMWPVQIEIGVNIKNILDLETVLEM